MSDDALLEVEGLTAGYTEEPIIEDVSMRAERGRITGIIGPNGCGKSTFLKAIVGIVQPTRGHVQLDGVDITRFSPFQTLARGLAYIPQGRQVFPDMSVNENLLMSAYTLSDQKLIHARFDEAFCRFPRLYERRQQRAGTLSGGEQSMLSFAMAMVLQPSCVLLDEPSLGLAPTMIETIFETILEMNEHGVTLVVVEQNINVLFQVADYVYILDTGRNRFDGPPDAILREEELLQLYMGVRA
jgi:branched-chain amino acid transport system ATP-binding protein